MHGNPLYSHTVPEVEPHEAAVVRRIYEMYDSGIHFAERDDVADLQTKVEREQKDVTKRLKQLTGLIENGAGDVGVLVARVRELEARQRELQQEAACCTAPTDSPPAASGHRESGRGMASAASAVHDHRADRPAADSARPTDVYTTQKRDQRRD